MGEFTFSLGVLDEFTGTLMNTRGLIELIVLNIGRDLGVISPTFFAMLVLMAVVTTMMASPQFSLLGYGQKNVREPKAQKADLINDQELLTNK